MTTTAALIDAAKRLDAEATPGPHAPTIADIIAVWKIESVGIAGSLVHTVALRAVEGVRPPKQKTTGEEILTPGKSIGKGGARPGRRAIRNSKHVDTGSSGETIQNTTGTSSPLDSLGSEQVASPAKNSNAFMNGPEAFVSTADYQCESDVLLPTLGASITSFLVPAAASIASKTSWSVALVVTPSNLTAENIARSRTLLPQLADALVAYHAKVRERAIHEAPLHPTDRLEYTCHLCGGTWLDSEPETHVVVDCPARPMEPTDG